MFISLLTVVRRLTVVASLLIGAAVITIAAPTPAAHALCVSETMSGSWRNINSATRSITRIDVAFNCSDQRLCDLEGNCSGGTSSYSTRAYGACSPADCDWGVRQATDMGGGWHRAIYAYSWSTKYVWIKTYTYYGRLYLRVWVHTDFTAADGRTDYTTDEWMLR